MKMIVLLDSDRPCLVNHVPADLGIRLFLIKHEMGHVPHVYKVK